MTFRLPFLTPQKNPFQLPLSDASRATNTKLLPNLIPINISEWLLPNTRVPSVKGRDYLQNMGMYTNPIPFNVTQAVTFPKTVISSPPQATPYNINVYKNPIPFNTVVILPVSDIQSVPGQPPTNLALLAGSPSPFYTQDFGTSHTLPDWLPSPQFPNLTLINGVPFVQTDWSKTGMLQPIVSDQNNLPNLSISTVGSPFVPVDFQKPWVNQGATLHDQTLVIFFPPAPFIPLDISFSRVLPDWLPSPQYPNIALLNTVQVALSPFYLQDFSKPFFPTASKTDQLQYNTNFYPNPIPFAQYDWSKGFDIPSVPTTQYPNTVILIPVPAPFYTQDFSKPFFPFPAKQDQQQYNTYFYSTPFNQLDWSKTGLLPSVPSPRMGTNVNLFTNPVPFNKSDWTYYYPVRPIVSDQNNLPNIAGTNPSQPSIPLGIFGWTDWNKVKWPAILLPDQDNLPNLVLLINPPSPPSEPTVGGKWRWLEDYNKLVKQSLNPEIKEAAAVISSLGGHARAKSLTSKQRSTIASKAASIRWK